MHTNEKCVGGSIRLLQPQLVRSSKRVDKRALSCYYYCVRPTATKTRKKVGASVSAAAAVVVTWVATHHALGV